MTCKAAEWLGSWVFSGIPAGATCGSTGESSHLGTPSMSSTTPDKLHLERRHQTWLCVVAVPRPLQAVMGKRRLIKSLRTHDLTEARRRRHKVVSEFQDQIEAARRTALAAPQGLAAGSLGAILAEAMVDREVLTVEEDGGISDQAQMIEDRYGKAAALAYHRVATGRSTPLGYYVDQWLKQASYPARSQVQHRGTLAELMRWCEKVGIAADVVAISRKVAGQWIASVTGQIAAATINRKLSTFRAYWKWLVDRGHVEENPWDRQSIPKGRLRAENDGSRPFTDDELRRLLDGKADAVLAAFIRIGALTGARIESIAKLTVGDCAGGVFFIRSDKTTAGTRRIPIHSDLTTLITERCRGRKAGEWLFPECSQTSTGSRSAAVVKRFNTYRINLGVDDRVEGKRRSRVTFHSLRAWFLTAALRAKQPLHVVQQVIGHKQQGVTMGVYFGGDTLDRLRECVEAVRLPTMAVTAT